MGVWYFVAVGEVDSGKFTNWRARILEREREKNQEEEPNEEVTLVLIKPDAMARGFAGLITGSYRQAGLRIVAIREMEPMPRDLAERFYAAHQGKEFFPGLILHMSAPDHQTNALVLAGHDAVRAARALSGDTDPNKAAEGTIRQKYGMNILWNAVHASDSAQAAAAEIALLFPE